MLDVTRSTEESLRLLEGIGLHATRKYLARGRLHGVISAGQAGDGVEQDDYVVATLDHAFGLIEDDLGDLHVAVGRLVEGGGDDFGVYATGHVGHLLGAFVDEQDDHVNLRVIGGDGVGNVLEEHRLTGLRLCHDEPTLPLADGCKKVDYADGVRVVNLRRTAVGELEFLFGEKRCEMVEGDAVADLFGQSAVDGVHLDEREIFLAFARRADGTLDKVAGAESEELDL